MRPVLLAVPTLLALLLGSAVWGSESTSTDRAAPSLSEQIAELEEVRAQLKSQLASSEAEGASERSEALRAVEVVTSAALQVARDLSGESEVPSAEASRTFPDDPRLGDLDVLYDEIEADEARRRDFERAVAAARAARKNAEREKEEAESAVRRAARDAPETSRGVTLLRARALLAAEQARLARLEEQQARREVEAHSKRLAVLRDRASTLQRAIAAHGPALDSSPYAARAEDLRRRLEEARRQRVSLDLRLEALSDTFRRDPDRRPALLASVEDLQAVRDLTSLEERMLLERLERLEVEEALWTKWHGVVARQAAHDALSAWVDAAAETRLVLERESAAVRGRLVSLRERIEAVEREVDGASAASQFLTARLDALRRAESLALEELAELDRATRLAARVESDAAEAVGGAPLATRIGLAWDRAASVFAVQLGTIDDEPITIGKVLLAIFLLVAGVMVAARASRAAGGVLERRARLEPGVAGAIQSGLFYVLLIGVALFALRMVNFPLTAFTVAGGALAIGIGFGSQNVLNNFISGLILIFERPVRSHDLVEVEGTHGTVERIGLRSTRIRAQDGRHIVVPNSFFLETNVVNWTLSDELIRTKLVVGVVYGSDTEKVKSLLTETLANNERVLDHPKPLINFADFGESSLDFHVYFWTRTRAPMGSQIAMSELRYEIDKRFRAAGIVIAFPQQDVHLDSTSPVQVALVDSSRSQTISEESS